MCNPPRKKNKPADLGESVEHQKKTKGLFRNSGHLWIGGHLPSWPYNWAGLSFDPPPTPQPQVKITGF